MTYRATGRLSPSQRLLAAVVRRARRIRRPSNRDEWIGAVFVGLLVASMIVQALMMLVEWLLQTWWAIPTLVVVTVGGVWGHVQVGVLRARAATRRLAQLCHSLDDLDTMSPGQFEDAVRDLMIRDGMHARRVGGRGDLAADVIGTHLPTRQTVVVQCKHTTTGARVKAPVIYEVNGTAGPAHQAHVAVVVTNGGFTRDAQDRARQFRIALVDRQQLAAWAEQGASLPEMLALDSAIRGRRYRLRHRPR